MSAPSDRPAARQALAPFSRPLKVDDLPDNGLVVTVEATPAECAAVAEDIDLPAIEALVASFKIAEQPGGRVQVDGEVKAHIRQVCVVSLEAFESDVAQPIAMTFAHVKAPLPERHSRQRNKRDEMRRAADARPAPPARPVCEGEVDPPDPIVDGRIDLGAVAVEFLTLALDFYPKKPGIHFSDVMINETEEPKDSAFAALERFKDRS